MGQFSVLSVHVLLIGSILDCSFPGLFLSFCCLVPDIWLRLLSSVLVLCSVLLIHVLFLFFLRGRETILIRYYYLPLLVYSALSVTTVFLVNTFNQPVT